MRRIVHFLILFVLASWFGSVQGQSAPTIFINQTEDVVKVTTGIDYLEDTGHAYTIEGVIASQQFKLWPKGIPNFAITRYVYWLRIHVQNTTSNKRLLLKVSSPTLDSLTYYEPMVDGSIRKFVTGESFPFKNREYISSDYLFNVTLPSGTGKYIYIRASSAEALLLPLSIGVERAVFDTDKYKDIFWGAYIGLMLAMLFYNMFVYITTKDKSYLYYIAYVLTVLLTQITMSGYGFQLVWPNNAWLAHSSAFLAPPLVGIAGMEFMRHFLRTKEFLPKADKGLFLLYVLYGIAVVAAFAGIYKVTFTVIDATASAVSLYMLGIAIAVYRKGYRPAGFFLISWSVFLIGVFIFVFKNLNILPYNNFTVFTMPVGSALEVILLSFALADRINLLKKEKEASQAQAFEAVKENERIVREQNVILEKRVDERTHELKEANVDLSKAMTDLKAAQANLVESEKMASLGQLTAGIAHEINNPINFVTSNVKPLKRDVYILLDAIVELEKVALDDSPIAKKKEHIEEYKTELDFDYLKMEIEQLLTGIGDGASRTAEIVKGLRIFSRLDEDDIKKADINEGLNSTLIIANNLLNNIIKLERNYANLPMIECYPGKLNQVFLNIISNAVYAIKKRYDDKEGGKLTIATRCDENFVYISISDNGIGMDEKTKKRLFEPFFTTKDVGEGTGLGMSIAYNTINKHNGRIEINSELGVGTEFILVLPLVHQLPK